MTLFSEKRKIFKQRKFKRLLIVALTFSLFLGIIIVPIEAGQPNSTIHNLSDGLWWAFQTLTTVGYGDATPVTVTGRLVGSLMVLIGTVLFGIMLAMISSSMSRSQEEFYWIRLFERLDRIESEIDELKKQSKYILKEQSSPEREAESRSETNSP